nr:RNA-directed DNA polymerase, eukaryota, reverse transcriptase zinc-binding domain protein [Tanacetum cinerariifolium]
MTINKSKGQSPLKVGLYLARHVFTHGRQYVAVSRVKSKKGLKVVVCDQDDNISKTSTNVVYKRSTTRPRNNVQELLSFLLLFRFMGSYRSKEDDVNRISTSIFVTNFPESFSAKDLFRSCKQYDYVIDSFIPLKRSKEGSKFGFVHFINVFSVERLVCNLCTIWVDRFKFHANIAIFQRVPLNSNKVYEKKNVESFRGGDQISRKDVGGANSGKSFVNVMKSIYKSGTVDCEANPVIVLDEDCLNSKDLTNSLLGRVKEFASLSNLKMVLTNEGFVDISVRYMGELWSYWNSLILKLCGWRLKESRLNFGRGIHSKGLLRSGGTFGCDNKVQYARSSGNNNEVVEVPETNFNECIGPKVNLSDDSFGIYPMLNKNSKENKENVNEKDQSLEYPPEVFDGRDGDSTNRGSKRDASESTPNAEENNRNVNGHASESVCTRRFKNQRMEEVVKVETKIDNMELRCVRSCWGKYAFDYIHSNLVGNSGGILCVWDPNSFRKSNYTISDSFVIIRGVWLKNGIDLLIVAVYAHHDSRDKRMLWDYLVHTINQWDGEVVIMGDFNEGLEEVPLGGSAFTWCHKSATKMTKLDRHSRTGMKEKYKEELRTLDDDIDNGNGSDTVVHKRMERIDKLNAMEIAQKTKIKCNGFDKPMEHRAVVDMCYLRSLLINQQEDLERMVTKEEVKRTVWDCGTDKSPGPDGFTFRPISLIGSIYKIIAKILANRLVRVLGDILNEVQSAFIAERQILDGLFILNEVLQWCKIKKKQSLIFKVDFEKAMNMSKSKIMGVHVEGGMVKHATSKLGRLTLNIPFYYLGFKVRGSMSRVQAWKEVAEVSFGIDSYIPYVHFRVPSSVLHTLESTRSQFFNGHEVGNNKATWVKWNSILTAKDSGGLGVSSLYALNRGLMMKWVWRFYNLKTSLWANVIKAIHGEDGSMGKAKYACVRTCWTTIVNEIRILSDQGVNVLEFMRLKMGNGDMASFWNDNWFGGGVLKDLYPRLYALENGKSVNVCTKLSDPSMDYSFRRKTRGGAKQEQLDALMDLVSTVNLVSMGDRWVWTLESSGEFSVASLQKVIDEKRLSSVCSKTQWVKYVPIKVNVLAWKIKMDVLPTRLNISRRGIDIHSISCLICDCGVESSEHLFFRCNLTRQIARKISLWWNVNYEDVNSYDE